MALHVTFTNSPGLVIFSFTSPRKEAHYSQPNQRTQLLCNYTVVDASFIKQISLCQPRQPMRDYYSYLKQDCNTYRSCTKGFLKQEDGRTKSSRPKWSKLGISVYLTDYWNNGPTGGAALSQVKKWKQNSFSIKEKNKLQTW